MSSKIDAGSYFFTPATVERYLTETMNAVDTAAEKGVRYIDMDPVVAMKLVTDLGTAHEAMAQLVKHSCKSKFVPGVVVGFGGAVVIGMYMAQKDKRKKA